MNVRSRSIGLACGRGVRSLLSRIVLNRAFRPALMVAGLLACAACGQGDDSAAVSGPPREPEPEYVGGETCAGCHAEETARWAGSHHDLAMQPATEGTVLGRFDDTRFVYGGVETIFSRSGSEFRVMTDGPEGERRDFTITHTFGVYPLQQYVIELQRGRHQVLGIAWDARPAEQGGQRWFHLYPDEAVDSSDPLHWTRAPQSWNTSCAACHSTGLVKNYAAEQDAFETTWASIDVDCEACHGPGSAHAAAPAQAAMVLRAAPRAWVHEPEAVIAARVPPAGGEADAEIAACAQCHSRRAQIQDGFAAGDPLLDSFMPERLEEGLYHADGQILDEVYVYGSFLQSAMHGAGVTCSDCHDPHNTSLRAEGDALCGACHLPSEFATRRHHRHEEGGAGSACVDCHMREETYMVVDPRRDHSFRVPRPDLSATLATPNACNDCHDGRSAEWAAERVRDWYPEGRSGTFHYGQALHAARSWSADRVPLLRAVFADPDMPAIVRATAVGLLAEQVDAAVLATLEQALADDDELVQLAAVRALDAVPARARVRLGQRFLTHPRRALRISAARALAPLRAELGEGRRGDLDAALGEYVAVQRFNSDRVEGLFEQANLLAATRRWDAAEVAYKAATEREPAFAPAYANLADVYRQVGREADAEKTLRAGLAANPEDASLHVSLGLSLVRGDRLDEALPVLRRARELDPEQPYYSYVYAVALGSADRREQALDVLTSAAQRFAGHVPTLFALAAMHRDAGDVGRALQYTRRLLDVSPADANGRALLAELEAVTESE